MSARPDPPDDQAPRPRGRPRGFDVEAAMEQLVNAFWQTGYGGTSLDDLSRAAGLARPSLYAAFGDKHAIYIAAIDRVGAGMAKQVAQLLNGEADLAAALRAVFAAATDVYLAGPKGPRGCLVVCTASVEAISDDGIRQRLAGVLAGLDQIIAARFERARAEGRLAPHIDPRRRARLVAATIHSLAVRARAGTSRAELAALADEAADTLTR